MCSRKAEVGLKKVIEREGATGVTLANNKHLLGYGTLYFSF